MSEAKKFNPAWLLAVLVPLFIIIGVSVFLNSKDCDTCLTGWATLDLEWPSFWVWAIIGIVIGIACIFAAIINENRGKGSTGKTIFLIILAIAFITGPWGKACTDKANQGVTAPGHVLTDSTNIKATSNLIGADTTIPINGFTYWAPGTIPEEVSKTGRSYLLSLNYYCRKQLYFDYSNLNEGDNLKLVQHFWNGGKMEDISFKVRFKKKSKDFACQPGEFVIYDFHLKSKSL